MEALLRRDRIVVGACLGAVSLLAAYYIYTGAGMGMTAVQMSVPMQHMGAAAPANWTPLYSLTMFFMWWAMMIAMMLPSAAPTILLSAALNRRSQAEVPPYGGVAAFTAGYLLAWAGFSAVATALQWWLEHAGKLSMHMESIDVTLNGALLLVAGIWQFTPLKAACLKHCRSPVDFLVRYRRQGTLGALQMGAHHGLYCLGCCWFLMALLFVGGVMNLFWIIGLAALVFAEKVLLIGHRLGQLAGAIMICVGVAMLAGLL